MGHMAWHAVEILLSRGVNVVVSGSGVVPCFHRWFLVVRCFNALVMEIMCTYVSLTSASRSGLTLRQDGVVQLARRVRTIPGATCASPSAARSTTASAATAAC